MPLITIDPKAHIGSFAQIPTMTWENWVSVLYWDRFHGEEMQRAVKNYEANPTPARKGVITAIVTRAKAEVDYLTPKSLKPVAADQQPA